MVDFPDPESPVKRTVAPDVPKAATRRSRVILPPSSTTLGLACATAITRMTPAPTVPFVTGSTMMKLPVPRLVE